MSWTADAALDLIERARAAELNVSIGPGDVFASVSFSIVRSDGTVYHRAVRFWWGGRVDIWEGVIALDDRAWKRVEWASDDPAEWYEFLGVKR